MELKELNQTIKVGAVFKGDQIVPKWFMWEGTKYIIKDVNYNWLDKVGREKLHCFSVTDGTNNFEISFHAEKTLWRLDKIFEDLK